MKFWKNNSLSIVFFVLFLVSIVGQVLTGLNEHNRHLQEDGGQQIHINEYFSSGHFFQSTFENWESEFLQMALFVLLSIFLFQKGSSESKEVNKKEEVDREPDPNKKDAPWPVRQGGIILDLYKHSLTIVLLVFFLLSFLLHWYGSMKDFNEEQQLKGKATQTALEYLGDSRLWFESFQNWQSEFFSIFAIVVLSVFLRQKGSPQSKPVDAPNKETGS